MTRTARALVAVLVVLTLVSTSCGGSGDREPTPTATTPTPTSSPSPSPPAPRQGPAYVALGDSYTAGGPIGTLQEHGFFCQRSSLNYPSVVATTLDLPLTDVSCGGATSAGLLRPLRGAPAQIEAIRPRTRVVTVGIGGNDFGLYNTLLVTCPEVSKPKDPGSPCRERIGSKVASTIPAISGTVGKVLADVAAKAPKAEIVLVGYPRLMPPKGECAAAPFAAADVAWIASMESTLAASLAAAARAQDVTFVPMYARSKGHDLCGGNAAWVNGLDPPAGDGLPLHPNAAGEKAVAGEVAKTLRKAGLG